MEYSFGLAPLVQTHTPRRFDGTPINKQINNQRWAIRREFEHVGRPTLLKNPLDAE